MLGYRGSTDSAGRGGGESPTPRLKEAGESEKKQYLPFFSSLKGAVGVLWVCSQPKGLSCA